MREHQDNPRVTATWDEIEAEDVRLGALTDQMREDIDVLAVHLGGVPYAELPDAARETADFIAWTWELEDEGIFWPDDEDDECELPASLIRINALIEIKATDDRATACRYLELRSCVARLPGYELVTGI